MGFVTGEKPCPPEYILDSQGNPTTTLNPDRSSWIQLDQTILGIIMNSVTTPILGTIAKKHTSAEAWQALEKHFACSSQHHVHTLSDHSRRVFRY